MLNSSTEAISRSNIYILAVGSILLGIIFDYLFFEKFFGISVFIFEAVAIILALLFGRHLKQSLRPVSWLLGFALFFVAMVAIRANSFLAFLNIVASIGLLLLATQAIQKKPVINFRIPDYFYTFVTTPFKILRYFLQVVSFLARPSEKSSTVVFKRVIIGMVMALPFLIIFGALFASADLAFKQLVDFIFRFQVSDELFGHIILIVGVFAISLGVFAFIFNIPPTGLSAETSENSKPEKDIIDRNIEVKVFLWMIAGLFAVFLIFQMAYLFGGVINISQGNFTYAEYARKGFWELLVVAFFTLVILLIMDKYTQFKSSRLPWFIIPSLVLILEIFVIIISAFKRIMLYQDAYGLTILRLYVSGFIIFLGIVFILLAIKLWREKEDRFFAFAAFLSMVAFLVVFNILNPDAFIARKNIEHFNQTGNIDAEYLVTMSADAVPAIVSVYDRLNDEDKDIVRQFLSDKKAELLEQQSFWQSYNVSRQKALDVLIGKF